ncbi:MAG: hypothetical protein CUN55_14295 [Phototrophicales bacterium]|nr:MAG: hypothetical protein CUN55_14295 [Phototrophicales bacterium]
MFKNKLRLNHVVVVCVCLIILGALWLYTSTAAQGLIYGGGVESESAQLQRVANRLGIAHSTGYPLHTMLGYLAARMAEGLGENPYTAITYTSSVAAAIGLAFFFLAARQVGNVVSALGATALLAVSDTLWHTATITETQALHFACMAAIWWGILAHIQQPQRFWPLAIIALGAGVGLANHRTIVFSIGAAGIVVLWRGAWRAWSWKRWIALGVLLFIPLLSYGYLFIRAQDPHVVYSTRPTWFPAQMSNEVVIDLIRGTLQSGEGLEGNLVFPRDDAPQRLEFVYGNLSADIGKWWLIIGGAGWLFIGIKRPSVLIGGAMMALAWIIFLMSWRLDWKAVIYQHALLLLMALGWAAFFDLPRYAFPNVRHKLHLWGMLIFSVPLFIGTRWTYAQHLEARDLSSDRFGDRLYAQLDALPPNAIFQSGGWTPDAFIALEYLDDSGRMDVLPMGADSAEGVASRAQTSDRPIIIGPFLRGFFGLYSGSLFFQERGLSFSGTGGPDLFQLRPYDDLRLTTEADAATVLDISITPEVTLYSYILEPRPDYFVLTLYWRAESAPMPHYSVFTHLRAYGVACDESTLQGLISQDDSSGTVRNMHPTTVWHSGEIVKDTYFIPRPPALPQGAAIVVGMTLNGERIGQWCTPALN